MIRFKKIKINKVNDVLKRVFRNLAEHGFLTFLVLFIISFTLGVVIFFKCSAMIESPVETNSKENSSSTDQDGIYKSVKEWIREKENFSQAEAKQYSNPFLR